MVDKIVVIGAGGVVGGGIASCLRQMGRNVVTVSARRVTSLGGSSIDGVVSSIAGESMSPEISNFSLGLVLAHRYRGDDPFQAMRIEFLVTRDLTWALSRVVSNLRVVVVGSVTGALVCEDLPEAYHYSKDIQKSITRQSCRLRNVQMNVLELSCFEKHPQDIQTPEYMAAMSSIRRQIGYSNLPSIADISNFIDQLMSASKNPRGQVISFDGGYSLLQK